MSQIYGWEEFCNLIKTRLQMTINFNDEMEPRKLCVTFKFVDVEYFPL